MKKTVSFSKDARNIFFHILTKCNLNCIHCYINKEQHGTNTLPISTIEKWLSEFSGKSRDTNVIFLGGEPTLHPDLSTAIKKAHNLGYKSITVDTNGYLFNNIISKVDPGEIDFFSFSLDGATRQTNDMIRGTGSYDRCIAGIKSAIIRGFDTSLIYTVSSMNINELNMMAPLLKELGIDRFFIQVIGIRGKPAQKGQPGVKGQTLQVPRSEWEEKIPEVAGKIASQDIKVTYPKVFLDVKDNFECAGLVADNYFIFPNGRVYRCPLCEDFPVHSLIFKNDKLIKTGKINESHLFQLNIPEGCVMNRIIQPDNISYSIDGKPEYKIACCLLKEEAF